MTQITLQDRAAERGTTIVETAIILLSLFMFLFGIMEAGRAIVEGRIKGRVVVEIG